MARFSYGGQAVIEGVMMRGAKSLAIAVRRRPEEIVLETQPTSSITIRYPFLKWPILRGFIALIEAMIIGVKALTYSANQVVEGEGEGETLGTWELALTVVFALSMGVGLFFLLPAGIAHLMGGLITSVLWQNLVEGIIRILIFVGYVLIISRLKDIQRVFQYHGAEHKVIHAFEAGEDLIPDNVRKYSNLHPRCGTSFLLIVMVISILVFSLLGNTNIWMRLFSRIALLPLVAGISYEVLKAAGKYQHNKLMQIVSQPGMWLQKLTTREPDDSQIEVAIMALNKVLEMDEVLNSDYVEVYDNAGEIATSRGTV